MSKNKKKQNNKGFSLVELIIVMAIIAILVGAIAPQLFSYLEEARKKKDLEMVSTVFTAVQTAMASSETAPAADISCNLDTFKASYPLVSTLLDSSMNTVAAIKTKARSKVGRDGTLFIKYTSTTGKLEVFIATAVDAATKDIGPVTN